MIFATRLSKLYVSFDMERTFCSMEFFNPSIANVLEKRRAVSRLLLTEILRLINDDWTRDRQAFRYFFLLALNVPISSGILSLILIPVEAAGIAKVLSDSVCILISYLVSKFIFTQFPHPNRR